MRFGLAVPLSQSGEVWLTRGVWTRGAVRNVAASGVLAFAAVAVACSAFSAGDEPQPVADGPEGGMDAAGLDGELDGQTESSGGDAAPSCTPQPIDAVDAGEDASCDPGGPPVVLASSSMNCGRCGHDCAGDQCVQGRCVVTMITSGEPTNPSLGSVVGGSLLYGSGAGTSLVVSIGLDDAHTKATLATIESDAGGGLDGPVLVGSQIFAVHGDIGIVELPAAGGQWTTFLAQAQSPGRIAGMTADSANVYWATEYRAIEAAPRPSSGTYYEVQAGFDGKVAGLASDGSRLQWATTPSAVDGGPAPTGTLNIRGTGKTDSTVARASGLSPVAALTFDADYIYIASADGVISRVTKAGTSMPVVITRLPGDRLTPKGFTVDDGFIYIGVTDGQGGSVQINLFQAPKCGGPARLLTQDAMFGPGLVAAGSFLYWSQFRAIARIAK